MSTESGSEVIPQETEQTETPGLVHNYCMASPYNLPTPKLACCGAKPKGDITDLPLGCPLCAELEEKGECGVSCACWW